MSDIYRRPVGQISGMEDVPRRDSRNMMVAWRDPKGMVL
jgi:hypothetical protein